MRQILSKLFVFGFCWTTTVHAQDPSASNAAARGQLTSDLSAGASFVSDDPRGKILPPDRDPEVRLNPEAPPPFIAMARAYQEGDRETAQQYARQFVRYLNNVIFQVKDLTQLIGEAMIQEGLIGEEDWVGVEQYIDREFATARDKSGSLVKATHEEAMRRIVPDLKQEVEVYYFFSLSCSWCRKMGPDVERLWRATKNDKRVKMVALSTAPMPKTWAKTYREYTGMTMPMFEGTAAAKAFKVGFVPAVIVVTPNNKQAYVKSGEQTFERLYEFVRRAQGLPADQTPEIQRMLLTPIGYEERKNGVEPRAGTGTDQKSPSVERIGLQTKEAEPVGSLGKF